MAWLLLPWHPDRMNRFQILSAPVSQYIAVAYPRFQGTVQVHHRIYIFLAFTIPHQIVSPLADFKRADFTNITVDLTLRQLNTMASVVGYGCHW